MHFSRSATGIDAAAAAGIKAVIQRARWLYGVTAEVIAAADEHGMTMIFTGVAYFRQLK